MPLSHTMCHNYVLFIITESFYTSYPVCSLLSTNSCRRKLGWHWGQKQQEAFARVKELLISSQLLVHYDPRKEIILSCDASPYSVGTVLSHIVEDGSEKPVAYASRSLAPTEKKSAQLEKEGLAIVFGVRKFHQYLHSRQFSIYSDH